MSLITNAPIPILVQFLGNAKEIYGPEGLAPATSGAAGIDLRACLEGTAHVTIEPGHRERIPSGIAVEPKIPGVAGFLYSRSGLGAVKGLVVAQGVGVIDPDYRGEICVFLLNTSQSPLTVQQGDRIAQLIFQPFYQTNFQQSTTLGNTQRGEGGFGHTGQ